MKTPNKLVLESTDNELVYSLTSKEASSFASAEITSLTDVGLGNSCILNGEMSHTNPTLLPEIVSAPNSATTAALETASTCFTSLVSLTPNEGAHHCPSPLFPLQSALRPINQFRGYNRLDHHLLPDSFSPVLSELTPMSTTSLIKPALPTQFVPDADNKN
ncbi:unnamed protein product, partial [Protopolystoma xenopodis]